MIEIVYTRFDARLPEDLWQDCLQRIPPESHREISRFRRWQDRHARLFGRLLLVEALERFGYGTDVLKEIDYDENGRPCLNERVDVNISHSGAYVLCAATDSGRVGIDIEEIRPIDLRDFGDVLGPGEWRSIQGADNPYERFYGYWTMRESVVKAHGKGLSTPLDGIPIDQNRAILYDKVWFIHEVPIDPGYKCHLATEVEQAEWRLRRIRF